MNTSTAEEYVQRSDLPRGELIIYIGLMIIFTICGVFANGYIVVIVGKHKQLRNNTGIYFIVLLTVCELLSCLGRLAQTCYNFAYVITDYLLVISTNECVPMLIMSMPTFGVTQIAHFTLTFDRYFAVHKPLLYRNRNHLLTIKIVVVFLFIYFSVLSTAILLETPATIPLRQFCRLVNGLPYTWVILLGAGLISGVGMIIFSVLLIFKARVKIGHAGMRTPVQKAMREAREKSVTWTVVTVALMYTTMWFIPNMFLIGFSIIAPKSVEAIVWQSRATRIIGVTSAISSCANIFVYAWRHPDLSKYIHLNWKKVQGSPTTVTTNGKSTRY